MFSCCAAEDSSQLGYSLVASSSRGFLKCFIVKCQRLYYKPSTFLLLLLLLLYVCTFSLGVLVELKFLYWLSTGENHCKLIAQSWAKLASCTAGHTDFGH